MKWNLTVYLTEKVAKKNKKDTEKQKELSARSEQNDEVHCATRRVVRTKKVIGTILNCLFLSPEFRVVMSLDVGDSDCGYRLLEWLTSVVIFGLLDCCLLKSV